MVFPIFGDGTENVSTKFDASRFLTSLASISGVCPYLRRLSSILEEFRVENGRILVAGGAGETLQSPSALALLAVSRSQAAEWKVAFLYWL